MAGFFDMSSVLNLRESSSASVEASTQTGAPRRQSLFEPAASDFRLVLIGFDRLRLKAVYK
jgi:hypothetical protein